MMWRRPSTSKKWFSTPGQTREAWKEPSAPVVKTLRGVEAVLAFEEIAQHIRIVLIADHRLDLEIGRERGAIIEIEPLPVFFVGLEGLVLVGIFVVDVVVIQVALAPMAKVVSLIEARA